jgi:hypothetical protein
MENKYLIDLVKEEFGLKTDTELAYLLGEKQPIVAGWRTGRRPIPVNIKLRMCEHIKVFEEIKKFVEVFGNLNEHKVNMTQDLDRLEEIRKKEAGVAVDYVDMKWIERVSKLQEVHNLSDDQTAKYLEIDLGSLRSIKDGRTELQVVTKALLLGFLSVEKIVKTEKLKRNLDKRLTK